MKTELCASCGEKPIYCKKRMLCQKCYGKFIRLFGPVAIGQSPKKSKTLFKDMHKRESEFAHNYFTDDNWIYQPAVFRFGQKYSPDFYDATRNVFIEVVGSRQAYHQAKSLYVSMRKHFPKIILEIRKPSGELIDESIRISWGNEKP